MRGAITQESFSNVSLGVLNPFRYRWYYYDTETGFYFLQTRYYDPEVGRFINQDSISYADLQTINGLNLYAYCLNNPVMYTGPSGNFIIPFWVIGAIVGFAVSFTGSAVSQAVFNQGNVDWGVAAVDGLFGAISGALATTGIGTVIGAFADAGLEFANDMIVTGMQNSWNYSYADIFSVIFNAAIAGFGSAFISSRKIGFRDSEKFKVAEGSLKKFNSKVARKLYKNGQQSIKAASKHVNKMIVSSFASDYALFSYLYIIVGFFV